MKRLIVLCLYALASTAIAEPRICAGGMVTVDAEPPLASVMCETAEQASRDLAACNLPLKSPIQLTLSRDLEELFCVGMYHCGDRLIEVLPPDILETANRDTAMFYGMDAMAYFKSVIFHEMVHAAYDGVPCPFDDICRATTEYLA